jgi:hypothetical protein
MYCQMPDCARPVFRAGLCAAHVKRQQRGADLSAPIAERKTAEERVIDAGDAWLAADGDEDYETTRRAFIRACEGWMRARGWRPPDRSPRAAARPRERTRRSRLVQMDLLPPSPLTGRGS